MLKIFYLITELDIGGAEKALHSLVTNLDRTRFEPTVGCLTGRGPMGEWFTRYGVEVVYFDMRSLWDVRAWLRLRKELGRRKPDVLHTFLFHANLAGRLAGRGRVGRVISSVRVEEPRRWHLWGERLTRGMVDLVTCVSESTRDYVHRTTRVPLEKLVVVPNGVTLDDYRLPAPPPPPEWNVPDGVPVVGIIGRLDRQKDPVLMLRVAAIVTREMPRALFVFAGKGPLAAHCRVEAEELGVADSCRWLGWVPEVRPLLGRMDLLALSSRWEGMPNTVLEAMASRKSVVATQVGGSAELVLDGETGFLVPCDDPEAMADRILQLLQNPALRQRMGEAGLERVDLNFSLCAMVEANQRLYREKAPST